MSIIPFILLLVLACVYSVVADLVVGAIWHYASTRIERMQRRRWLAPLPKRKRRLLLRARNWARRYYSYWEDQTNWYAVSNEREFSRITLEMQPAIDACRDAGIPIAAILFFTKGLRPK